MDSMDTHNAALLQAGYFNASDLEANRKGQFSQNQVDRFRNERDFIQQTTGKYENKAFVVSLIFGAGALFFCLVLYFVGVFEALETMLGGLFLPAMAGLALLAALFIFVIVPRQYQSSVDMYRSMGTPLAEIPLGAIQTVEAGRRPMNRARGWTGICTAYRAGCLMCSRWTASNSLLPSRSCPSYKTTGFTGSIASMTGAPGGFSAWKLWNDSGWKNLNPQNTCVIIPALSNKEMRAQSAWDGHKRP